MQKVQDAMNKLEKEYLQILDAFIAAVSRRVSEGYNNIRTRRRGDWRTGQLVANATAVRGLSSDTWLRRVACIDGLHLRPGAL